MPVRCLRPNICPSNEPGYLGPITSALFPIPTNSAAASYLECMAILFLHDEHYPGGWRAMVVVAIVSYLLVQFVGWLAGRKLRRLPGYKNRRPGKKGVDR